MGRAALALVPRFRGGDYYDASPPARGLALARMISHKTYVSLRTMEDRPRNEVAPHDAAENRRAAGGERG